MGQSGAKDVPPEKKMKPPFVREPAKAAPEKKMTPPFVREPAKAAPRKKDEAVFFCPPSTEAQWMTLSCIHCK